MKNNILRIGVLAALWLGFVPALRATNTVTLSSASGSPGEEVQIDVSLDNTDNISAMQIAIPLKGTATYVDNSCDVGTRAASHVISAGVKNDTLNIFVYSASMKIFSGSNGVVASFKLKLGKQPLTLSLQPSKLILTDKTGTKVDATATAGSATCLCAKAVLSTDSIGYGRVPLKSSYSNSSLTVTNSGNIDLVITALTFSSSKFTSTATLPLTITAGGSSLIAVSYAPTVRGYEACTMQITSNAINRLDDVKYTAIPFAVNELHIPSVSGISDSIVTVTLNVNNMDELKGFQFEFNLTPTLKYVEGSFALSSRAKDHVSLEKIQNDTLRLMSYSASGATFTGNDGTIATFQVKLNGQYGCNLQAYKTILTAMIDGVATNVTSASEGTYVNINSPNISYSNTVNMGATPVTETASMQYDIRNYGSADLVIDRIVFDTLHFSIKEALPIIIKQWQSGTITILYNGATAGAFSTLMQIYNNTPSNRVSNVNISGTRFEPNYITLSTDTVLTKDTLAIKVAMSNYSPISGFQLDLVYPYKYYTVFDDNIIREARANKMQITYSQLNDSTLRIIGYSLTGDVIAQGESSLFVLLFKPTPLLTDNTYRFTAKNVKLGNATLTNMYSGDSTTNLDAVVFTYLMGDVDHNGVVTITDAVYIINKILNISMPVFIAKAADIDGNGKINITDAVLLINRYILKVTSSSVKALNTTASASGNSDLEAKPFTIAPGEERTVDIVLNNTSDDITAFQVDLNLPEGFSVVKDAEENYSQIAFGRGLEHSHQMGSNMLENGDLRIVCYSMKNASIEGTGGAVATVRVKADNNVVAGVYYLTLHNTVLAHTNGLNAITPADVKSAINVGTTDVTGALHEKLTIVTGKGIITLKASDAQNVHILSADGKQIARLTLKSGEIRSISVASGIYIVNNRKIIVK
jgi:hypothetical protein